MATYKIALDFDETIVQSLLAVSAQCVSQWGFPIPEHVYRHSDWENPLLDKETFRQLIFGNIVAREWAEDVVLLPGALAGIAQLIDYGLEIDILTARGLYEGEIDAVRYVCKKHNFNFLIIFTYYQPKKDFLDGHMLVLDDQIHELAPMPADVHRLLLRRPHNKTAWHNANGDIIPVDGWSHAVATIKKLLDLS